MDWVEADKEHLADILVKDQETIKQEYELIEFASNIAEELKKSVKRTQGACAEFCRRVLLTYNWCQTSTTKRLVVLPKHEMFLNIYRTDTTKMNEPSNKSRSWRKRY